MNREKHIAIQNHVSYVCMLLTAFAIPLYRECLSLIIVVWAVVALFSHRWLYLFKKLRKPHIMAWLFAALFAMSMLALAFFTENTANGWFKIEIKLSYIVLPFLLLPSIELSPHKKRHVMWSFLAGNILAGIVSLVVASSHYNSDGQNAFYYTHLSFFHHTSYFACYLTFALVILFFDFKLFSKRPKKWVYISVGFFIFVMIYLLSSKAGLLALLMVCTAIMATYIFRKFSFAKLIGALVIIGSLSILFFSNTRMVSTTHTIAHSQNKNTDTGESTQSRILVWQVSAELIQENWILGTSPGDASDILVEAYHNKGYSQAEYKKLNCHNQFLETFLMQGIVGLLLLIAVFVAPMLHLKFRNINLFSFFLFVCGFNFLFESMLEKQSGIIFFVFFYIFFIYDLKTHTHDSVFATTHR